MLNKIYIEQAIEQHPRVQRICARFPQAQKIICQHYREVFNPKSQNFRLQKQQPALILAHKPKHFVLKTPEGFAIGGQHNYYFSHMLNCLYDCRYCFLQGMYHSANYVLFINYEDFMQEINATAKQNDQPAYFFSGYDGDSLAYEPVSGFLHEFLPFFRQQPNAILELRTKSVNVRELLRHQPFANCVVAFSFTPQEISRAVEHGVPLVSKRIDAMRQCAQHGWQVGLRFDPLIDIDNFKQHYQQLIMDIFTDFPKQQIHSVSVGPLRFPQKMYQRIAKLYPQDRLLAEPLVKRQGQLSYAKDKELMMKQIVLDELAQHLPQTLIFECHAL